MKFAMSVKASVFCKDGEDAQKIERGLRSFFPFGLEEEGAAVKKEVAEGFNEKKIIIYSVLLVKDRHLNAFFKSLLARLSAEQKRQLLEQADSRLDESLHFFVRFDKDALLDLDQLWLTDEGNCFHFIFSIAAFPKKKDVALGLVREFLQNAIAQP